MMQIYWDRPVERTVCRFLWNPERKFWKILNQIICSDFHSNRSQQNTLTCSVKSPFGQSLRNPLCHCRISFSVTVLSHHFIMVREWKKSKRKKILFKLLNTHTHTHITTRITHESIHTIKNWMEEWNWIKKNYSLLLWHGMLLCDTLFQ